MIRAIAVDKDLIQIEKEIDQLKTDFKELPITITLSDRVEKITGSSCRHNDKFLNQNITEGESE